MIKLKTRTKQEKKDKCHYCHHFPIFSLLEDNNLLPLLHLDNNFLWIHETSERIN